LLAHECRHEQQEKRMEEKKLPEAERKKKRQELKQLETECTYFLGLIRAFAS
jgi:hypothetical protein